MTQDQILQDRLIIGIRSEAVREKLLLVDGRSLDQCLELCRADETTKKRVLEMKRTTGISGNGQYDDRHADHHEDIHALRNKRLADTDTRQHAEQWKKERKSGHYTNAINDCRYCGGSHQRGRCPAYGVCCNRCGKKNHFARRCSCSTETLARTSVASLRYLERSENLPLNN